MGIRFIVNRHREWHGGLSSADLQSLVPGDSQWNVGLFPGSTHHSSPVADVATILVFVSFVYVPIAVAESVESGIFTPPVTVSISFTVVIIHCITNLIEFPFSDEYMDLPLLEFQCCFNGKLLASPIGFVDESSTDTIFASPERVYRKEKNSATNKQKIARYGPQVGRTVLREGDRQGRKGPRDRGSREEV